MFSKQGKLGNKAPNDCNESKPEVKISRKFNNSLKTSIKKISKTYCAVLVNDNVKKSLFVDIKDPSDS